MHLFLVGAGPVGLVTAVGFARLGHRVTVTDIEERRIATLRRGSAPFYEPGLDDAIGEGASAGLLDFTTDPVPPADATVSIVCVGTPSGPDGPLRMDLVETAVRGLLATCRPGHVVVVRSTLPADGPARLAALVTEHERRSGACATVVTNPEFMREGNGLHDFEHPSRVVTGWLRADDAEAAERIAALYAPLDVPCVVADAGSVALIKLASNVFLATKLAFANELARLCDALGADVDIVTAGIGLDDRIGPTFLQAGPGYGGSCLPEQAVAMARDADRLGLAAPLIAAASGSNDAHHRWIVRRVAELLGRTGGSLAGVRVGLLGLAFKAETDDVRESPALALAARLRDVGADVAGYDPKAEGNARRADPALVTAPTPLELAQGRDVLLVATEWREFASLDWGTIAHAMRGDLVYDARNVVDRAAAAGAGLRLEVLGRR